MKVGAVRANALFLTMATVAVTGVAASAASPLAGIPVGQSVNYRLSSTTTKPDSSPETSNHSITIRRLAPTAFGISVDGAPAGQIAIDASGNPIVPPSLKKVLAPFGQVALLMRGAPQPLAAGANWSAALPVPIKDETDDVPLSVSVTQLAPTGATVVANGQNTTSVQAVVRDKPTEVTVSSTMIFNAAHVLTSASSNVSIVIHAGRVRTKHAGNTWSLSLAGP